MPLSQKERKHVRDVIALLDEQDLMHTPVKESSQMKGHRLAPELNPETGVRPAALDHAGFSYLHEGPDDNCPVCHHITLNRLQREKLQELLG